MLKSQFVVLDTEENVFVFYARNKGWVKKDTTCFCQNIVKFSPNLLIFGIRTAKTI